MKRSILSAKREAIASFSSSSRWEVIGRLLTTTDRCRLYGCFQQELRKATQGRIDQEILSAAGLRAVRWLTACRMISSRGASEDEELGAAGALEFSISQINDRMGRRRGAWLNALSLIAKPLLGALYENSDGVGRLYADGTYQAEVLERRSELLAAISELLAAIDEIRQADGARVIGPNVPEDVDGFRRLIKLSPYAVNVIRRAMIDGMEIGSIKTWHYFRGAIADEERVCADASEFQSKMRCRCSGARG